MASCVYDTATFLTNKEYAAKYGQKVNVQSKVESPHIYIIARSSSSDLDQLAYVNTRLECLEELSTTVASQNGNLITDKMRFFHGDSPSRQFESGHQKGGHYYCSVCGCIASRVYELDYVFRCSHMSLSKRQEMVPKGPCSRKYSLAKSNKPFENLSKNELERELGSRAIYEGKTKKDLEKLLKEE